MVDFTKPIRIRGTTKVVRYLGKLEREFRPHLVADRRQLGHEDVFAYDESMLENAPQMRWRNIYENCRPEDGTWHESQLYAWLGARSVIQVMPDLLIAVQQDNGDGTFTWFGREFYGSYLNKE